MNISVQHITCSMALHFLYPCLNSFYKIKFCFLKTNKQTNKKTTVGLGTTLVPNQVKRHQRAASTVKSFHSPGHKDRVLEDTFLR